MNYNLLSMTKTNKGTMYIKIIVLRDSEKISIGRIVRLIKCPYKFLGPYNGFNNVRLMSVRVIESQSAFY